MCLEVVISIGQFVIFWVETETSFDLQLFSVLPRNFFMEVKKILHVHRLLWDSVLKNGIHIIPKRCKLLWGINVQRKNKLIGAV